MSAPSPRLLDVRTGHARRLNGHVTAYGKDSRAGPVAVHALGLAGDEVANTRVHGGPEKALYAYSAAAYARWRASHPQHDARLVPGAFGENLLFDGLDEASVCIGDRWRVGTALLEPCQPRQPCSTLARWFEDPAMVKAMVANGLSGWYCRVLEPGELEAGVDVRLEHRPQGAWTIAAVLRASYSPADSAELLALSQAPGLAGSWAAWAARSAKAPAPKPL
jgi:MOSC domain-containing protein YiiM